MDDTRDIYKRIRELESHNDTNDKICLHDSFDIELNEHFVIESGVIGLTEDGSVIIHLDERALQFLNYNGMLTESEELTESILNEGVTQYIMDAIADRIIKYYKSIIQRYGKDKVIKAIEDIAYQHSAEDIETLTHNKIKQWTKEVITLLESESTNESMHGSMLNESSYNAVVNAIRHRILHSHHDLIAKYGPVRIMAAIEDCAAGNGDLEEIGSSDISIWTRQVIEALENGYYDHIDSTMGESIDDSTSDDFFDELLICDDPYKMIYDGINGDHGEDIQNELQRMFEGIAHDYELHFDDDFDLIIDRMIDEIKDSHKYNIRSTPVDPVYEAEYHGRKVSLGKPMKGDVKKSKVYVRKPNGKVVKVNFGDKNMRIKKTSPSHRKSFRARHHCENPGPRWKARYWSCRAW